MRPFNREKEGDGPKEDEEEVIQEVKAENNINMCGNAHELASLLYCIREARNMILGHFDENNIRIIALDDGEIYVKLFDLISVRIEDVPVLLEELKRVEIERTGDAIIGPW